MACKCAKEETSHSIPLMLLVFTEVKREKIKFDVTLFYSPAIAFKISTYTRHILTNFFFVQKMLKLNFLFYRLFMEEVILRLPSFLISCCCCCCCSQWERMYKNISFLFWLGKPEIMVLATSSFYFDSHTNALLYRKCGRHFTTSLGNPSYHSHFSLNIFFLPAHFSRYLIEFMYT